MSPVEVFLLAVVLVFVVFPCVGATLIRPHAPWWETLIFAGVAAGLVILLYVVSLVLTSPSACNNTGCDTSASVGVIITAPPAFLLALAGAAVGKLIGRRLRKPPDPPPSSPTAARAGWYPDPWRLASYRYWDGRYWTSYTE